MGMTVQYATVTEWEMQPILAGGAREIVEGVWREYKQGDINPRFRERLEAILSEFWDDPRNVNAKHKLDSHLREEHLRFQKQYLAGSRLIESSQYRNFLRSQNADPASPVDELCEYYVSGGYLFLYDKAWQASTADAVRSLSDEPSPSRYQVDELNSYRRLLGWCEKAKEIGLSEEELTEETRKRGLRFVLDLNKGYRNLHPLLPGEHYYGIPEPGDTFSIALYGERDLPKDSCPTGFSDERDCEGYGPPRYVTSAAVKDIAAFFNRTSFADLVEKNGLEPETDWTDSDEFDRLKSFYLRAAQAEYGVLVFYC